MRNFLVVKADLSVKFLDAVQKNAFPEFLKSSKSTLLSWTSNDMKNVMELMLREVLIKLIKDKANIDILERVFQFSIDTALHDYVAGNAPVLIIGDMFESSTIGECENYFSFLETRVETFKKDIFFKACKNHLLRYCNDLLKRLSRSQNTVFCGRILMFLAHIFPLSERSGLNIISEFNLENTTAYSTTDDVFSDLTSEKGDTEEGEISQNQSQIVIDKNLYQKFWSLQDYFRSPNTCYNKMKWRELTNCTSDILTVFGSFKSDAANSSKWKQVKLPSTSGSCVYFAKYLTSPKLLELELSDSHFRRYVLVQFLILFQYLMSPVKFKPESYILSDDQQKWIKGTTANIYKLLEETPPNGEVFARDTEKILQREEYWNAWKNDGCPDFKQIQQTEKVELEKKLRKRPSEALHTYGNKKSNAEVTKIWSTKPNNWEACRSSKRNFVPSLETFFGITGTNEGGPIPKRENDSKYTWKALRLLCMKSPHIFTANTAPTKSVSEYLDNITQKLAREKPQAPQDVVMTVETAMADDEAMEDTNDEFFPASEEDSKEEDKKENVLTKSMIQSLSEKLGDKWQALAFKLGFQEDEVEYYECAFPDPRVQTEQMLTVWTERDGCLATFTKVLEGADLLKGDLSAIVA